VQNGDRIVIDIAARRLDLDVPAAELAARPAPAGFAINATGYLGIYRRDVQSMASGAVLTDLKP
jgi:dihydroxy-acid dehydratase